MSLITTTLVHSSQSTADSASEETQLPILSLRLLFPWLLAFFCLGVPIVAWTGAYDPGPWKNYSSPWPNPFSTMLVYILCGSLSIIPLCWVVKQRVLDLLALALAQNALIFGGYFYFDQTAAHITESSYAIIQMAGLMVLLNAVGFFCFFISLGGTYALVQWGKFRLGALPAPPTLLDERLVICMRVLSLFCAASIALPMVLTRTIPLLSANGAEARLDLVMDSDVGRAIYHMGTALLPFVVGTLVLVMVRQPKRVFGWDGVITVTMVVLQLLTSNRLPLSITLMVTLCLLTMQYRLPRWVLVFAVVAYVFLFTFLSGFTALLRNDPQALEEDWFGNSIQEAYLGDNIIDLRDGAWVLSQWDFQPLLGTTYLGGAVAMLPSGLFPEKKQWHLGLTGVRIVGLPDDAHFGLRITFFGESFLNFGWAGVIMLGTMLGAAYGIVLRQVHLAASGSGPPCLCRNVVLLITLQCGFPLFNTSDAFIFWALLGVLALIGLFVILPASREPSSAPAP